MAMVLSKFFAMIRECCSVPRLSIRFTLIPSRPVLSDCSKCHCLCSHGVLFRQLFSEQWRPAIAQFAPQLILVSAGFDAHGEDEMAHLKWNESDYQWVAEQLKALANQYCQGGFVACLEGGYALSALGRSVVAMLKAWV